MHTHTQRRRFNHCSFKYLLSTYYVWMGRDCSGARALQQTATQTHASALRGLTSSGESTHTVTQMHTDTHPALTSLSPNSGQNPLPLPIVQWPSGCNNQRPSSSLLAHPAHNSTLFSGLGTWELRGETLLPQRDPSSAPLPTSGHIPFFNKDSQQTEKPLGALLHPDWVPTLRYFWPPPTTLV